MSAPDAQLRAALDAALRADAGVRAVLGDPVRLFEVRDSRAAWPHASWGRCETSQGGADGVSLLDCRLNLDIWCRDSDPAPVLAAMRTALAGVSPELPPPWTLVSLSPVYSDVFTTSDRRIRRGLIRLRALLGRVDANTL